MTHSLLQMLPCPSHSVHAFFMWDNNGQLQVDREPVVFFALAKLPNAPEPVVVSVILSGGGFSISEGDECFCGVYPGGCTITEVSDIPLERVPEQFRERFANEFPDQT